MRSGSGPAAARSIEEVNAIIVANLDLVRFVARRYAKYCSGGLEFDDLVQEGVIGLRTAAMRFDPATGAKFSTFSVWWIRQAIVRALGNTSRAVRLPVWAGNLAARLRKTARAIEHRTGRPATTDEIAAALGVSKTAVADALAGMCFVALEDVEWTATATGVRPDEVAMGHEASAMIEDALASLTDREAAVLRMRFGLDGRDTMTLAEVGDALGCTHQGARYVEQRSLERLRANSHERDLLWAAL